MSAAGHDEEEEVGEEDLFKLDVNDEMMMMMYSSQEYIHRNVYILVVVCPC